MPVNCVNQQRTKRPALLRTFVLLSAGLLSAPLSHASVKGEWSDNVSRDQSFSRGLVIAVDFRTTALITTVRGRLHVTSKLYEPQGATVVYTLDTKVRNVESTGNALLAISAPIAKKLRRSGLIL